MGNLSELRYSRKVDTLDMPISQSASVSLEGDPLATLPKRQQRGSRARCILLTNGSDEEVACRLSGLAKPFATIDADRDRWMPRGFADPAEAKLGEALSLLSSERCEAITCWWLAVREHANTPNWDIAATATIDGTKGLLLVEAKAHTAEIKADGKANKGRTENHRRIGAACLEASTELNSILPGWSLSLERNYQLCNRFAWAWKLASLGVPVVLVYLGFLRAQEMRDQGLPLADGDQWEHLVREHSKGVVPPKIWDEPILVGGVPLHAKIHSMEMPLAFAS
jgi:hypothetical protein